MDHEFIKLDSGIKIHFKEFGKSGPKLLLVHGWNNDWSGFVPLIENLESKFMITTIDLPGYGLSEPIHGEYTIESLSDVVCEFIDKKCDTRVDLVCALSMGSVIVADFAKRHSEKTKAVVVIGPPIIKYDWIWSRMYRRLITFVNKNTLLMKIGHKLLASSAYGHFTAKYINMHNYDKDLINKHGLKGRRNINARALFQMGSAMYNYHLEKTLKEIKIPMLIILGRYDKVMNLSEAARIGESMESAKLSWVEEAGHVVSLEKPKETAGLVIDFARERKIL